MPSAIFFDGLPGATSAKGSWVTTLRPLTDDSGGHSHGYSWSAAFCSRFCHQNSLVLSPRQHLFSHPLVGAGREHTSSHAAMQLPMQAPLPSQKQLFCPSLS